MTSAALLTHLAGSVLTVATLCAIVQLTGCAAFRSYDSELQETNQQLASGNVDAALALQQAVDHLAAIATAIGQARIGRQQRFAVSASGEQQGKGKGSEWAHSGIRIIERRVCRSEGAIPSGLSGNR